MVKGLRLSLRRFHERVSLSQGRSPGCRIAALARLPRPAAQWHIGENFPVTVAGPRRTLTGFPILPHRHGACVSRPIGGTPCDVGPTVAGRLASPCTRHGAAPKRTAMVAPGGPLSRAEWPIRPGFTPGSGRRRHLILAPPLSGSTGNPLIQPCLRLSGRNLPLGCGPPPPSRHPSGLCQTEHRSDVSRNSGEPTWAIPGRSRHCYRPCQARHREPGTRLAAERISGEDT
jgi:hypothetical protein